MKHLQLVYILFSFFVCATIWCSPCFDSISSMSHFPQSSRPYKREREAKKAKKWLDKSWDTSPPPWFRIDCYLPGRQRQQIQESKKPADDWSKGRKHTKCLLHREGSVRLAHCDRWSTIFFTWLNWNLGNFVGNFRISLSSYTITLFGWMRFDVLVDPSPSARVFLSRDWSSFCYKLNGGDLSVGSSRSSRE